MIWQYLCSWLHDFWFLITKLLAMTQHDGINGWASPIWLALFSKVFSHIAWVTNSNHYLQSTKVRTLFLVFRMFSDPNELLLLWTCIAPSMGPCHSLKHAMPSTKTGAIFSGFMHVSNLNKLLLLTCIAPSTNLLTPYWCSILCCKWVVRNDYFSCLKSEPFSPVTTVPKA